jgi:hypothetical protein
LEFRISMMGENYLNYIAQYNSKRSLLYILLMIMLIILIFIIIIGIYII